jgi:hypothetical protein
LLLAPPASASPSPEPGADPWPWTEEAGLLASDSAAYDYFGISAALDGDTALVGADYDDDGGAESGSAYLFQRSAGSWSQAVKLTPGDGAAGDWFGRSVSLDGATVLIGAPGVDDAGADSGSAYVFTLSGTQWTLQAELCASDGAAGDQFGHSVCLDGDRAIIGARYDQDQGYRTGSAYVFVRSGTTWSQEVKLTASDAEAGDWFGHAVCLCDDTALVGAFFGDAPGVQNSGAAYVFTRTGTAWSEQAKLWASDAAGGSKYGSSVSIDGDTALVGSPADCRVANHAGASYVYVRASACWSEQAKLISGDAAAGDSFGTIVSLEGDTALVSACMDDGIWGTNQGSAYLFARTGTVWSQRAKLEASDSAAEDCFGSSLCLDEGSVLVGAYGDADAGCCSGSAYLFRFCTSSTPSSEVTRLGSPPNPNAFLPGLTSGPVIGAHWDPVVTSFHPGAFLDFVAVDLGGPIDVPTGIGTLLIQPPCDAQIFLNLGPGTPFSIAVPFDDSLVGVAAWSQAGSIAPGPDVALANGLDLVFGTR